jgi:antitoxin component YwqK of YwqJK toxin-antitoxin module
MLNHHICTLLAVLCTVTGICQHTGVPAGSATNPRLSNNIGISIPSFTNDEEYSLPKKGALTGRFNEKIIYRGTVKDHRLHGTWQSWYRNGQPLDSGVLVHGIPDGAWKVWDSSGTLLSVRSYHADKFHRVKEEMRLDHPRNTFFPLVQLYKKDRAAAKWHLQAGYSFTFPARTQSFSIEAIVEQNSLYAGSYQPVFHECLHHGLYMNYFSNGIVKDSGYYKDGLKEGLWIHHNDAAGSWFSGAYKNGMRQYEWKHYDANGRLMELIFYDESGKVDRRKKIDNR